MVDAESPALAIGDVWGIGLRSIVTFASALFCEVRLGFWVWLFGISDHVAEFEDGEEHRDDDSADDRSEDDN